MLKNVLFNFASNPDLTNYASFIRDQVDQVCSPNYPTDVLFVCSKNNIQTYNNYLLQARQVLSLLKGGVAITVKEIEDYDTPQDAFMKAGGYVVGGSPEADLIARIGAQAGTLKTNVNNEKLCIAWNEGCMILGPKKVTFPYDALLNVIPFQVYCHYTYRDQLGVINYLKNNAPATIYCLSDTATGSGVRSRGGASSIIYGVIPPDTPSAGFASDANGTITQIA